MTGGRADPVAGLYRTNQKQDELQLNERANTAKSSMFGVPERA
jgi:hypothetical protein